MTNREFLFDPRGARFRKLLEKDRYKEAFEAALQELGKKEVQAEMEKAETTYDRPLLAGALRFIEWRPEVEAIAKTRKKESSDFDRWKQAIGMAVLMWAEANNWEKKLTTDGVSVKGSLKGVSRTDDKGASYFSVAQRYTKAR